MEALKTFLKRFIREVSVDRLMYDIMKDERLKGYYLELNKEQLYEQGEDADGNSLEPYSYATMQIKKRKGQVYDRTTLKDTGKFYRSFKIRVYRGGFIVDADGQKENINLFDRYGIDILGLNEVNSYKFQTILAREIRSKIIAML